jgi:arylsulfatase A-like enzyme
MAINRRSFIGSMVSGIAATNATGILSQALPQTTSKGGGSSRPNFLFIIADDLTYRAINSHPHAGAHTPNIDRLAASGCQFSHCFHQGSWSPAVCVPSRTMLNTGLSAFHARDAFLRLHASEPHNLDDVQTWAETFRSAGYETFLAGKWHLDATLLKRGFKETGPVGPGMLPSTDIGGDAYYRPRPGDPWTPWDESLKGHWLHTEKWEATTPDKIEHSSILYANHVVDYLSKAAKRDDPFFIYLGFNAPHDPRQSSKDFLDLYPEDQIEVPPNFLPEHPFDQGDFKIRDEILAPFPRTREAVQLHRREYYSIITHMDHQIGRILDGLDASGKASNTYIIFTADHGLALGEQGLIGKQNMYDCSIRMPLMISGPGISKGAKVDELVYQHSMYATTCDLAGISIPKHVEFSSLAPMLHGDKQPVNDAVFSYYKDFQRMVRTKRHKLIVYPQIQRVQLFDMEKDPWEMHDLVHEPSMQRTKAELLQRLQSFQRKLGDTLDLDHPTPVAGEKNLTAS